MDFIIRFKEYNFESAIVKQAVSQLQDNALLRTEFMKQPVSQIPWGHNILLIQRIKKKEIRLWYIEQTILNGWSRDILTLMIKSNLYLRQGEAINNFSQTLPPSENE